MVTCKRRSHRKFLRNEGKRYMATLFDLIAVFFGIYMIGSALKMKRTGEISTIIMTAKEIEKCKDKAGYIAFIYWKEAVFGALFILVGIIGFINSYVVSLGLWLNAIDLLIFLGAFLWFYHELGEARERYVVKF